MMIIMVLQPTFFSRKKIEEEQGVEAASDSCKVGKTNHSNNDLNAVKIYKSEMI